MICSSHVYMRFLHTTLFRPEFCTAHVRLAIATIHFDPETLGRHKYNVGNVQRILKH